MTTPVPAYFDTLHVGTVEVAGDGALSWHYAERWRAARGAFPISLTMPLGAEPVPEARIAPWLANLLPEEEQLSILSRALGLGRADVLALLAEIGGDTAGALSFSAPADRTHWAYTPLTDFYGTADPHQALERHFDDLGRRPFLAGAEGVRLSLAGGQKKSALAVLSAQGTPVLRLPGPGDILAVPRNGAPSTVILKPDNPNLPGITENEVWCLHLAEAIGIPAVRTTLLGAGRRSAICALRYDRRTGRDGRLIRVHQEDFAQANGVPPGRKYERGTRPGPGLRALLSTADHLPATDALALLDLVIFNILVANTDAHAKNYSVLLPVGGPPRLAPLYDVSCVLPWPHVTQFFAQSLAGKRRKPGRLAGRHWDAIAREMGYRPADLRRRVQQLVDRMVAQRVAVTETVCAMPGASRGHVEQAAALVEANALRIAGRLTDTSP
ncbi:type II toxin-antitoxin system HipA family toxin (plasmid) [Paroceanicella profunda]|uniref:Type II toxin-antitoxin system HipA family toxin n=1 Tax=Paroceanicella profunda TaxID=2579971 RepID=A0A5B8G605_9RHOB|nr:type II toxin-antitoxin system HipA family toxin [Paroceanicella profunda]QDL94493.1 type II toxin-antitoxin system HipA family toxin [Paroceanicella profunda]